MVFGKRAPASPPPAPHPPAHPPTRARPQALKMARGLAVTGDVNAAAEQIKALYRLFDQCDCTMVEVRAGGGGAGGTGGAGLA
jgi:hypothetical protein